MSTVVNKKSCKIICVPNERGRAVPLFKMVPRLGWNRLSSVTPKIQNSYKISDSLCYTMIRASTELDLLLVLAPFLSKAKNIRSKLLIGLLFDRLDAGQGKERASGIMPWSLPKSIHLERFFVDYAWKRKSFIRFSLEIRSRSIS